VVMGEDWQTVDTMINTAQLVGAVGLAAHCIPVWTANNIFGFDDINWGVLSAAAQLMTVSRYMKHEMWRYGVNPLVAPNGVAPSAIDLRFGFDPLGLMATGGVGGKPWNELAAPFADLIRDLARQGFRGPFAAADGRPVHAAGGSEAQELAFALASAKHAHTTAVRTALFMKGPLR